MKASKSFPKILHVLSSPRAEGTPKLVLDWLRKEPDSQSVLFLNENPATLLNEYRELTSLIRVNRQLETGLKKVPQLIKLCLDTVREFKPEIVIAWPTGLSQYIHIGSKWGGAKTLLTHAGNPPSEGGLTARYFYSYLTFWISYLLNVKIIACSAYVADSFKAIPLIPKGIFHVVHNAIDLARLRNQLKSESRPSIVSMVATMEQHKDHLTLLKAWQNVTTSYPEARLFLAGDGSLRNHLEDLARRHELINFEFLGSLDDVADLLKQTRVFVLSTTRQEGFGTVLLEALTAGCQVVATDVPACREVLLKGKFGKLVPSGDSDSLAIAILEGLQKDNQIDNCELEGYLERFSIEAMMHKYLAACTI